MLKSGLLAASKFNGDAANTSYTHVVYQDTENSIQESRYDNINGWTTSPDPVIAPGDKVLKDSPIAIVTWNFGRERRVYFLDMNQNIRERAYSSASAPSANSAAEWKIGGNITASPASDSQLAVIAIPKWLKVNLNFRDDSPVLIATLSVIDPFTNNSTVAAAQSCDSDGDWCVEVLYYPVTMIGHFTTLKMAPRAAGGWMDGTDTPKRSDVGVMLPDRANELKKSEPKDGSKIAFGSYGCTIRVWNSMTTQSEQTLTGHSNSVTSVTFSPDGKVHI